MKNERCELHEREAAEDGAPRWAWQMARARASAASLEGSAFRPRSVRTMKLRVERQMENAIKLAAALDKDPRVRYVNYPTMEYHPQHDLAMKLLPKGSGPMLSFRVEDDRDKVNAFIRELSMVQYLGTLGGFRTSLAHPATAFRMEFSPEELLAMGLEEGLIRISVGIEEPEDIIGDITNALKVFD